MPGLPGMRRTRLVATVTAANDEGAIKARLDAADVSGQVGFASACAERLFPLYELFTARTGQGDPALLRDALDRAWAGESGATVGADVEHLLEAVEGLVPDDDQPDFSVWSPLAQHAAAAVAYALRLWLSGESQNGVWAARQLFEVADYVLQLDEPGNAYVDEGEPVALALGAIESALAGIATGDRTVLRDAAVTDGQRLRRLASNGPLG